MNVKARRKTKFGKFGKLWEDDSALGVTGGIFGAIISYIAGLMPCCGMCWMVDTLPGLVPCGVSCCQNLCPFGCCCGPGNLSLLAPCAWITDIVELFACKTISAIGGAACCGTPCGGIFAGVSGTIVGWISGVLGDITAIGGTLIALASSGGNVTAMTSFFR